MRLNPIDLKAGLCGKAPAADAGGGDFVPASIESEDCTACGECIEINPSIFGWNDDKVATVINPKGGPYKDIVKAAERCPARVIHPGTPADPNEKGLDDLLKRAKEFN